MEGPLEVPPDMVARRPCPDPPRRFVQVARSTKPLLLYWVLLHFSQIQESAILNSLVYLLHTNFPIRPSAVLLWASAVATCPPSHRQTLTAIQKFLYDLTLADSIDHAAISQQYKWSRACFTKPLNF